MDPNKLNTFRQNNLFIDLILTITDSDDNSLKLSVHKIILAYFSDYFKTLFTKFGESFNNEITIEVPNAYIMSDLILSFYGENINSGSYPDWYHCLEMIRCCDFWVSVMIIRN